MLDFHPINGFLLNVDDGVVISAIVYSSVVGYRAILVLDFTWWPLSWNCWSDIHIFESTFFLFLLGFFWSPVQNFLVILAVINSLRPWLCPMSIWLKLFLVNSLSKVDKVIIWIVLLKIFYKLIFNDRGRRCCGNDCH